MTAKADLLSCAYRIDPATLTIACVRNGCDRKPVMAVKYHSYATPDLMCLEHARQTGDKIGPQVARMWEVKLR